MASTHVLYEEDGAFKAATVLAEAAGSLQVEAVSGKRSKVKGSHVMLRFAAPSPADLMQQAQQAAQSIDLDFLWECAPQEEFGFMALAQDYYGHAPSPIEATSLLLRLHAAPVYFYRKGRGCYRAAPPDTLRAALAAVQRKKEQAERVEAWAQALVQGAAPEAVLQEAARLLVRPDRNGLPWKALERACALARLAPAPLLLQAGAFPDAKALHVGCFLAEHFPAGAQFAELTEAPWSPALAAQIAALPRAQVEAFSIDDSTTTEIDDGLSVTTLPDGRLQIGVHIAAPGLGIAPGDGLDQIARERMSTVYMPGDKITMLPDAAIECFSLEAGREVPALSLYLELDASGTQIVARRTCVERIVLAANLRHDQLDGVVTEASLAEPPEGSPDPLAALPQAAALRVLWRLALGWSAERDRVRGKPEALNRIDFSFYVDVDEAGLESVRIVPRRRDAPLDRIVAECMILANASWGGWLAEHQVPGIYRSQQAGGRVRMSSHPLPHQGLGVAQYGWATSPLRRYVDLVNQRQIMALALAQTPPYAPKDADLFAVISAFDVRYGAYADFQQRMERYWCLRWLTQMQTGPHSARVVREDLVRLVHSPLYVRMPELPALGFAPGRQILIEMMEPDLLSLTVSARYVDVAPEPVRAAELVELEDELSGVDEVPGPPAIETGAAPGFAELGEASEPQASGVLVTGSAGLAPMQACRSMAYDEVVMPAPRVSVAKTGAAAVRRAGTPRPGPGSGPARKRSPAWVRAVVPARWRVRDPLALAMVVSVLLHGLVLFIRFAPPRPIQLNPNDARLEVVLLNAQTRSRPVKPDVLAQVDQEGGGEHERGRARSPLPAEAMMRDGTALQMQSRRIQALEAQQRELMALARGPRMPVAPEKSALPPVEAADDEEIRSVIARMQAEVARNIEDYNKRPRRLTFGVNAVGVNYARYVADWATRIERIGTERYPPEARGRQYDSLIITVDIDKHGNVVDIVINKKSKFEALNRVVKQIVYAGQPYERFPADMARDGDILQIVRTWTFTNNALETRAIRSDR